MTWLGNFYRSAVGKKAVMAVTGVILFAWIFIHMLGNLKLYLGPEHMNAYAHWLRTLGSPALPEGGLLWISRVVLLVCVGFHIHCAWALTMMNWDARPIAYRDREFVRGTYASRTMRWGGVILLLFVIYHLLDLTTGTVHRGGFVEGDPYHNVVTGFQIWWVAAVYIVANLALGLHLYHGLWSMFSSVGWVNPRFENWRKNFAVVFAVVITTANVSFPVMVLLGLVR